MAKFFPGGKTVQPEPGELQQSLLQFAESYSLRIIESVDEVKKGEASPFTPESALRFKIASVGSVVTTATGENPNVNLLNLMAMASLSRMALEHYWVKTPYGDLFDPWLQRSIRLEKKIWGISSKVLTKEQQDELRNSIEGHFASLTNINNLFLAHPQDLMMPKDIYQGKDDKSVFRLASINPFSALDPTVREIAQTRLFAERALFTMQWMPWLLRWQSELLILETANQPEVAQALEDATKLSASVERASKAAESLSQTAAALPDQLSTERAAIVTALDEQEEQITTMLEAGSKFSESLNETLITLDALMKRFGVGEPKPPRDPNRKRFDILDYAKTADAFTETAKELNAALSELNATLDSPALEKLSEETTADLRGVLNHAFKLAAALVALIFALAFIYRIVARRLA